MLRQAQVIRAQHERVPPRKSVYYRGFDGLRAISIAFVLLTHLGLYHWLNLPYKDRCVMPGSLRAGSHEGAAAVGIGTLATNSVLESKL